MYRVVLLYDKYLVSFLRTFRMLAGSVAKVCVLLFLKSESARRNSVYCS